MQEEYIKDEQKNLKKEYLHAQEEVKRIQSVPLVIGQFLEAVDQNTGIVGSTTGKDKWGRIKLFACLLILQANYSPTLKKGGLYRIWGVCHSVCSFVLPFVIIFSSELFYRIYPNFVCALVLTLSSLGLLHIIFPNFVPEVWPFIYTKILFLLNILRTTRHIFTKFYIYALILTKSSLGLSFFQSYGPLFMPKFHFHSIS